MIPALSSAQWIHVADALALAGILAACVAAAAHFAAARALDATARKARFAAHATTLILWLTAGAMTLSMIQRGLEVNHFPSQTMSEVLSMFSTALLLSMIALHYALGLRRRGPAWSMLDDALIVLVLAGSFFTHRYTATLSTAQRDLPPALQSYWFPPHLSALIFSYATLAIAGLICLVYFSMRFWSGVFVGGQTFKRQLWVVLTFAFVPFAQVVTLPVLALVGLVFLVLRSRDRVPSAATLAVLERDLDDVSYRAFTVGMPFLTAGLFMGAFWAQEAWANYWGWDSKENSALISWLVYVVYVHLRMLGGYRGERAMAVLIGGSLAIFTTFQLFGFLPDSQKSMHRYTDDNVVPREGMQAPPDAQKTSMADGAANAANQGK